MSGWTGGWLGAGVLRFLIVSPVVAGIGAGDAHVEQVGDRMRRLAFTVNHKTIV